MEIKQIEVTVAELAAGYEDKGDEGVVAYGGKLDVRPPYQREFIYKEEQQDKVIDTVMHGYPLNTMYWAKCKDGHYEIIDGQQRTISVCRYCTNAFSHNKRKFVNLQKDEKERILQYKLQIYVCDGNDSEKLKWFETINIAGEVLTAQELRNAVYHGPWVSSARSYFSRRGCAAENAGKPYVKGVSIRQDYLETAIRWADMAESGKGIDEYMADHAMDADARALYTHFDTVIEWARAIFPHYRPQMKGIDWGALWVKHHDRTDLDADTLEEEVSRLMADEDVTAKTGIYYYVLDHSEERRLSIRAFNVKDKTTAYERQKGICPVCGKHFELKEMEADHIKAWSDGGRTTLDNCQMLCKKDNRLKSDV